MQRARETHLEALWAAMFAGDLGRPGGVREAAEAARAAPLGPGPPRAVVLLDAVALRVTQGHAAALTLTRAFELLVSLDASVGDARRWLWLAAGRATTIIALELWDFETWHGHGLAARQVEVAREAGALVFRIRALRSDGQAADGFYLESIDQLGRTRIRAELARSHLLYGEWLRRHGRRTEARDQPRTAQPDAGEDGHGDVRRTGPP